MGNGEKQLDVDMGMITGISPAMLGKPFSYYGLYYPEEIVSWQVEAAAAFVKVFDECVDEAFKKAFDGITKSRNKRGIKHGHK